MEAALSSGNAVLDELRQESATLLYWCPLIKHVYADINRWYLNGFNSLAKYLVEEREDGSTKVELIKWFMSILDDYHRNIDYFENYINLNLNKLMTSNISAAEFMMVYNHTKYLNQVVHWFLTHFFLRENEFRNLIAELQNFT